MNVSGIPINLSMINTNSAFGVIMLGKTLDSAEVAGEAIVDMMTESMELSVNPALGGNVDVAV
jgi:hypothetical protein